MKDSAAACAKGRSADEPAAVTEPLTAEADAVDVVLSVEEESAVEEDPQPVSMAAARMHAVILFFDTINCFRLPRYILKIEVVC
jgi:hypothetical protein